jgi:ribosome-associated protein
MIRITPTLSIDEDQIEERFIRASGPGGQNVNKVATAVQLRFDTERCESLPPPVRKRLARLAGRRMSKDGVLVIEARRFRSQEQNRQDARERLLALLREAAIAPARRKPTRPTKASKRRRLDDKTRRSRVKQRRGRVPPIDE